jgi:hypothetical protein
VDRKSDFPKLCIVDVERLLLHEHVDDARVSSLVSALRRYRVLKNPPLVMPISEGDETFVVLDGATRTTAFQAMGISYMIVQEARPEVDEVSFHYWHQAVVGGEGQRLLVRMRSEKALKLEKMGPESSPEQDTERGCVA